MLNLSKVYKAIEAKSSLIHSFQLQNNNSLQALLAYCKKLETHSIADFNEKIVSSEEQFAGALATGELFELGLLAKSFGDSLNTPDKVAKWKEETLKERITFATDGSQIEPDKNLSLFFGAVQVAWYINFHDSLKAPVKDVDFDLVLPNNAVEDDQELRQKISLERFSRETRALASLIERIGQQQYKKQAIAFFDGSLTLSFVPTASLRKQYQVEVDNLLHKSEKYKIPVVAFIDTSQAYNFSKSLEIVFGGGTSSNKISDAQILKNYLSSWGDRSAFFKYFDTTKTNSSEAASSSHEIGFCYLKTSSRKSKPARLELPFWVYEDGLLDDVVSVVLAECLVGNGYPYPIEVADSVAVIQNAEKEVFYGAIEKKLQMDLAKSSKLQSKHNRRKPSIRI